MDQALDHSAAEACAKRTLRGVACTGLLLLGAVLASVLSVDLPFPVGAADGHSAAQTYVPASERWTDLGPAPRPEALPGSDGFQFDALPLTANADDGTAMAAHAEAQRRTLHKAHGDKDGRPRIDPGPRRSG